MILLQSEKDINIASEQYKLNSLVITGMFFYWCIVEGPRCTMQYGNSYMMRARLRSWHQSSSSSCRLVNSLVKSEYFALIFWPNLYILLWVPFHLRFRSSFSSTKYTNLGANLPPKMLSETAPWFTDKTCIFSSGLMTKSVLGAHNIPRVVEVQTVRVV